MPDLLVKLYELKLAPAELACKPGPLRGLDVPAHFSVHTVPDAVRVSQRKPEGHLLCPKGEFGEE